MSSLRGVFNLSVIALNTVVMGTPLLLMVALKFIPGLRRPATRAMVWIADQWGIQNGLILRLSGTMPLRVAGDRPPSRDKWTLIISNHQTWADIFVLHCTLTRQVSPIKFFLKQELIWLPIVGIACWGLDFPFMKRYSREYLQRHPERRGLDLEATRHACRRFNENPASLINFLEGTRLSRAKQQVQQSPFPNLLLPRAGGLALVLASLGNQLDRIVDATIAYPDGTPGFWEFLCGGCTDVVLHLRNREVPTALLGGDYTDDPEFRTDLQQWVMGLWSEKQQQMEILLS